MMKMNPHEYFPGGNNKRRALGRIDDNIIRAHPYHCAVKRKPLREVAPCNNNTSSIQEPIRSNQSDDCIILDADVNTPMFIHQAEAMQEEIGHTEATEIEMEDIFEDKKEEEDIIIDIDECDKSNPLAVTDYIDDLYAHYKKTECLSCVPTNYMARQSDINERMRAILIDWLIEVHYKFELVEETLYLTVNIIDRFLSIRLVVRKDLQLVGITALLLACKYEEVSVPLVDDLIVITNQAYTRKEVLEMEKLIVNTLQFNLSVPTPYVFMRRFLKAAQSDKRMEMVSFYIMELCLVEYETVGLPASLLAAGAVYTAQCAVMRQREWSKTIERHSGYSHEKVLECGRMMVRYHEKASSGKLRGVYNKYRTSKYGYAANVEPAVFLLH